MKGTSAHTQLSFCSRILAQPLSTYLSRMQKGKSSLDAALIRLAYAKQPKFHFFTIYHSLLYNGDAEHPLSSSNCTNE